VAAAAPSEPPSIQQETVRQGNRNFAAEEKHNPGEVFRDCPECPEMVVVPAGEFTMGTPPDGTKLDDDERPQHKVTIARPFAVGKFEITVDQFETFVKASNYKVEGTCFIWTGREWKSQAGSVRNVGFPQTGNHPAACLNWHDAQAYVTWLLGTSGRPYRLLTE